MTNDPRPKSAGIQLVDSLTPGIGREKERERGRRDADCIHLFEFALFWIFPATFWHYLYSENKEQVDLASTIF